MSERECKGCGGSGRPGFVGEDGKRHYRPGESVEALLPGSRIWRAGTVERDAPYTKARCGGAYILWASEYRVEQWDSAGGWQSDNMMRCPACLGSGRVTDGPLRRDAEVDAETLRDIAYETNGSGRLRGVALWIVRAALGRGPSTTFRTPKPTGRKAARAAFRAVPGLRGE